MTWATNPWVGFFALVLCAWGFLFAMSAQFAAHAGGLGPGMHWGEPLLRAVAGWLHLPASHDPAAQHPMPALVAMWCLMSLAMMAPTAVPFLRTFRDMTRGNPGRIHPVGFWFLLAGYVAVWCVFAVLMATLQHELSSLGVVTGPGVSASLWFSAAVLAIAGAYQFSTIKQACLSHCRSPFAYFMSYWREGLSGALAMGVRHGAVCVGCCWALMSVAFVGGTMNLIFMGLAMVLMTVEKLALGRWLTAPLGVALLAAAACAGYRAF